MTIAVTSNGSRSDVLAGKTAKNEKIGPRKRRAWRQGRPGRFPQGRCLDAVSAVLQAIRQAHGEHNRSQFWSENAAVRKGARKLAVNKKTRRLSVTEIEALGKAMAYALRNGESETGLAVIRTLILTGYRREEAQAMKRAWVHPEGGFVAFPDTKGDAQVRAIGPEALKVVMAQPEVAGNPHAFASLSSNGPFTAASACFQRVCKLAGIEGATLHTLRHTFGSIAGELGFSELTIRAMLGHASQNVTQDYIHIDEALKLAVRRTSDEIARRLAEGASTLRPLNLAA